MVEPPVPARTRDADRSREAILDAAETLFAQRGYESASLQEIGRLAGVSRGTPGYFFGSKDALYRAVLERVFAAELEMLARAQTRATAAGGGPVEILAGAIESFIDFLVARPTFVRLVEREALVGGALFRDAAANATAMQQGLAGVSALLAAGPFRAVEPAGLLLSVLALCWFPLAHADTFARGLGLDLRTLGSIDEWKRSVVDLVLRGILAEPPGRETRRQ